MPTLRQRYTRARRIFGESPCLDDAENATRQDMRDYLHLARSPRYRRELCNSCLDTVNTEMNRLGLKWSSLDLRAWRANSLIYRMFRAFDITPSWQRSRGDNFEDPLGW